MRTRQQILANVEHFLVETGMPPTAFGKNVANDPRLVANLRQGRAVNVDLADKIMDFMADHRGASKQAGCLLVPHTRRESKKRRSASIN